MRKFLLLAVLMIAALSAHAGYQIQPNAPQITYQGRTFAIGAFRADFPWGVDFMVAVVEQKPDGWNSLPAFVLHIDSADLLPLIRTHGGIDGFTTWLVPQINALLATIFAGQATPVGEPTDFESALSATQARVNTYRLTVDATGNLVLVK